MKDKKNRDISTPDNITVGAHQVVWWKCSTCGFEWRSTPNNRSSNKSGCPHCSETQGESAISRFLEKRHILFEVQYKFKDRGQFRDDFVVFDVLGNVIGTIEYNGEQHYVPVDFAGKGKIWAKENLKATQERDKIKSDYLKARNIPQLIIPYWDFDNIEKLVSDFISELSKTHNIRKSE